MRTKIVSRGHIDKGKVEMLSPESLRKQLTMLPDGDVEVTFRVVGTRRSNPQNRYYWGVVMETIKNFVNENGDEVFTDEQIHHHVAKKFLGTIKRVMPNSEVVEEIKSTADLSKDEFGEYLEKIFVWAIDTFGVDVPRPEEMGGYEQWMKDNK